MGWPCRTRWPGWNCDARRKDAARREAGREAGREARLACERRHGWRVRGGTRLRWCRRCSSHGASEHEEQHEQGGPPRAGGGRRALPPRGTRSRRRLSACATQPTQHASCSPTHDAVRRQKATR
eukprot:5913232-Prymnesium_polylepis.1